MGADQTEDQTPPGGGDRDEFLRACAELLGHFYPSALGDRALALAALAAACARTPPDAPLDDALRRVVVAVAPLVGRRSADEVVLEEPVLSEVKRRAVESALALGPVVLLLDARREGVDVPDRLRASPGLKIRLGYNLVPRIEPLALERDGVYAGLSFGGVPTAVFLPWTAVWGLGSDATREGMVWRQSAPPESDLVTPDKPDPPPPRARLGVIEGGADPGGAEAPPTLRVMTDQAEGE